MIEPYYQSEKVTLYCGDCLEILPTLSGVDAVVTDPPYGVDAVQRGRCFGTSNACATNAYRPIVGDDRPFDPTPFIGSAPIVCLWGANHYSAQLPASARWLVWDKRDGLDPNPLADCELAWTNDTRPARLFHHRWMGMVRDSERGPRFHPSQKPVQLLSWTLDTLEVPVGTMVLDPFMGGGSCGVAAINRGCRFIGIEIDKGYCEIAKRRIQEAEQAFALFEQPKQETQSEMFGGVQ